MDVRRFVKENRHMDWQNARRLRELSYVHSSINHRSYLAAMIEKYAVNGEIGVFVDSTDCDWSRSQIALVKKAKISELYKDEMVWYDDSEGPTSVSYDSPETAKRTTSVSCDLALEAFEEGHSHVIYY